MGLKRVFQVTAMGEVWEELAGDLKFLGSFRDQATGIAEARREATLSAPSTVIVLSPDTNVGGELGLGGAAFLSGKIGLSAQIVGDLITKKVDGIAVSPANAAAIAAALQGAKAANIPIITWDSDLLDKDKGLRLTYIGTHNYDIGVNLAKLVMQVKPKGGTICIQSGGAAAAVIRANSSGDGATATGLRSPGSTRASSPGSGVNSASSAAHAGHSARCSWTRRRSPGSSAPST